MNAVKFSKFSINDLCLMKLNVVASSALSAQVNAVNAPNLRLLHTLQEWRIVFSLPGWFEGTEWFCSDSPGLVVLQACSWHVCIWELLCEWSEIWSGQYGKATFFYFPSVVSLIIGTQNIFPKWNKIRVWQLIMKLLRSALIFIA